MKARLTRIRGRRYIVFYDSHGDGLPQPCTRRAWRPVIYRPPMQVRP